jgi:hypothetical protein
VKDSHHGPSTLSAFIGLKEWKGVGITEVLKEKSDHDHSPIAERCQQICEVQRKGTSGERSSPATVDRGRDTRQQIILFIGREIQE